MDDSTPGIPEAPEALYTPADRIPPALWHGAVIRSPKICHYDLRLEGNIQSWHEANLPWAVKPNC